VQLGLTATPRRENNVDTYEYFGDPVYTYSLKEGINDGRRSTDRRRDRERKIDQRQKTLVFCATQAHALAVRDLVNQMKTSTDPNYCQRVTADDGELGEQHLRDFQDNEKTTARCSSDFRSIYISKAPSCNARSG